MRLDSIIFLCGFLPVVALLSCLTRKPGPQNALLLIAGLVFYAFSGLTGLLVLPVMTAVNYALGRLLRAVQRSRRAVLAAGVALDLAVLVCFKYLDLFLSLVLPNAHARLPGLGLAAPLGISFFTFKCISFLVDIYRAPERCEGSFFRFLLYVSFFPQLAAGPITRYGDFLPQLDARSRTPESAMRGLERYIVGLGKKLLLSGAAARIADPLFSGAALDARSGWLAALAFSLQIYFDFSGYSDMAIGLGQLFGFATPENFDRPYLSASVTEFWRRWHRSLSSWFRDYVYIPLGGSRKGEVRTVCNKLIVFALSGLWHGAAWTFLLWGLWHGLFAALEGAFQRKQARRSLPLRVLGHCYTLLVVCLGFVLFRAESPAAALRIFAAMCGASPVTAASTAALWSVLSPVNALLLLLGVAVVVLETKVSSAALSVPAERSPRILPAVGCALLLLVCILSLSGGGFAPFLYEQF